MRYLSFYHDLIQCNDSDAVFKYFKDTIKDSIIQWDYFVDWAKVHANCDDFRDELNLLNSLIGCADSRKELERLLTMYPRLYRLLPVLVAYTDKKKCCKILLDYGWEKFTYQTFDFSSKNPSAQEISDALVFAEKTGFLEQLSSKRVRNVPDYMFGLNAGLDSNARKNRGGDAMEKILNFFISDICCRNGFGFLPKATSKTIKKEWGIEIALDKTNRQVDFAALVCDRIHFIEANFYGGGGSKLKSTAGEYRVVQGHWKERGHNFIWITDGAGWHTTKSALEETFLANDYVLNLKMVTDGILEEIFKHDK